MTCRCSAHNGFLTVKGFKEAAQRNNSRSTGLTDRDFFAILDSPVSVSGLELERDFHVFDDNLIDEQYRRAVSGS